MLSYSEVQDFAFFAVNFGYSKTEYMSLTRKEKLFLVRAYEDKLVADSDILCAAVANAVANVFRKKNQRPRKLWKIQPKQADSQERQEYMAIARRIESEMTSQDGTDWVEKIYQANHRKLRKSQK